MTAPVTCPSCTAETEAGDRYCGWCGRGLLDPWAALDRIVAGIAGEPVAMVGAGAADSEHSSRTDASGDPVLGPHYRDALAERVIERLDPNGLARFPVFAATERLRLVGPAVRRNDGRFDLPDASIHAVNDKHVRRLNAMIAVLERLGPSHYAAIAGELDDCLPTDYRMDERNVHAWLDRYKDVFVWAGRGRYALKTQGVGIRADLNPDIALPVATPGATRRRGIGDEIAHLLRDCGPLPLAAVEEHILVRLQVQRNSIAAAVAQDKARRFVLDANKVVSLRSENQEPERANDGPTRLPADRGGEAA